MWRNFVQDHSSLRVQTRYPTTNSAQPRNVPKTPITALRTDPARLDLYPVNN